MGYADIDPVIEKWVASLGSKLCTEWNGEPARFFYTAGDPPFECFQISVERPAPDEVKVYACAVDTNDDSEGDLEQGWTGTPAQTDEMIASAVAVIGRWKARPRNRPDPPSPWE